MVSFSLVTYNTSFDDINRIVNEALKIEGLSNFFLIDNSPVPNQFVISDKRVKYIYNNKNLGYGKGHNIGLKASLKDIVQYHVVINPDIYFNYSDINQIIHFLNENKCVGHLMPRITDEQGNMQYLCKTLPSPIDVFLRAFAKKFISKKRDYRFHLKNLDYSKVIEAPYLSGCFMVLRTESLRKIGLFDERFFMYPEDIDLTRRMTKKYKTIYYPFVTVIHRHEKASYKSLRMKLIHIYNMVKYFNKYGWLFDFDRMQLNRQALKQNQLNK